MISIAHPSGYLLERGYIFDVVFREFLGIEYRTQETATKAIEVTLDGDASNRKLSLPDTLFATSPFEWLTKRSCPRLPLREYRIRWNGSGNRPIQEVLPILFGNGAEGSSRGSWGSETIDLPIDIFGSTFFVLTRYEEIVSGEKDEWGRFPAQCSILYRAGISRHPIVDEYVELLWEALRHLWPQLKRKPRTFGLHITHDVDHPLWNLNKNAVALLMASAKDVALRRNWNLASQRWRSFRLAAREDYREDPYNTFDFIMDLSERIGVKSAFFLKGGCTSPAHDSEYSLNAPWARALIRNIAERGHEIGIHPSFETFGDCAAISREFLAVRRACEEEGIRQSVWGGRQHYLRWSNPITWQSWEDAGLQFDSTLGFAEVIGFRCGTSHEYPCYNLVSRERLKLRERPLIVMDTTLYSYMRLGQQELIDATVGLAATCRRFGGNFTLLWHNSNLLTGEGKEAYQSIVEALGTELGGPS
jgi:hypothetical protein